MGEVSTGEVQEEPWQQQHRPPTLWGQATSRASVIYKQMTAQRAQHPAARCPGTPDSTANDPFQKLLHT